MATNKAASTKKKGSGDDASSIGGSSMVSSDSNLSDVREFLTSDRKDESVSSPSF